MSKPRVLTFVFVCNPIQVLVEPFDNDLLGQLDPFEIDTLAAHLFKHAPLGVDDVFEVWRLTTIGDSSDELYFCWRAKETIRDLYRQPDLDHAQQYLAELIDLFADKGFGPEVNSLGRTLTKWGTQITNWYQANISNRRLRTPTESANNLIKHVGFGFRNFTNYRTRVLLYAGKPDWELLHTVKPPQMMTHQTGGSPIYGLCQVLAGGYRGIYQTQESV